MFRVLTFNRIADAGLSRLPKRRYEVGEDVADPHVILLRSHKLHEYPLGPSLRAVARAGAGVNNVPVDRLSALGIPVFNTPGANANSVKELTLAAMLMVARNLSPAWCFGAELTALGGPDMDAKAEAEKGRFTGYELAGKGLGVVGLGNIGVRVANAAVALGMQVMGYDPFTTVEQASLRDEVRRERRLERLLEASHFVTLHVPLHAQTEHLLNHKRFGIMREGAVLLNFARAAVVAGDALADALRSGKLGSYVCDFPSADLTGLPRVVVFPHLGASTRESEENCARMAAEQLRDFLEDGTIRNAVNFPSVEMPRVGRHRLAVVNKNVPNMLSQISAALADAGLNIIDMLNKSRSAVAYTLVDVEGQVPARVCERLSGIDGVLRVYRL